MTGRYARGKDAPLFSLRVVDPMNIDLKLPADEATIRSETKALLEEIQTKRAEIAMLKQALGIYQKQCKHPGQVTGHNNRDGSWGNPCPVCGWSY